MLLGTRNVAIHCDDTLADPAANLLRAIERFATRLPELTDGVTIDFGGFTSLRLRDLPGANGDLIVCEPDFDDDPHQNFRDNITTSLAVVSSQAAWLHRLETRGEPARANTVVTWTDAALATGTFFLRRRTPVSDNDSGWHLGARDAAQASEIRSGLLHEWLRLRPESLPFLALPPGWIVLFDDGSPIALFDGETPRWSA